jgi:mRNA-degrading endonuclease toxin of MazEF toxin-antitoxin module
VRRGEVWWHEPPDEKPRPVLILTRDDVIGRVLDVVAMPATGVSRDWLNEVEIGVADGMPTECVLVAENTLSAEKAFLTRRMTALGAVKMDEVCRALGTATACG